MSITDQLNCPPSTAIPHKNITFAEVQTLIRNDQALSLSTQRDLLSAINTLFKHQLINIESTEFTPDAIRNIHNQLHPLRMKISMKRYQNIKSSISRIYNRYFGSSTTLEITNPTAIESWNRLQSHLSQPNLKYGLSRLIRYCKSTGVSPDDVSNETFQEFYAFLNERSVIQNPKNKYLAAISLWKKAKLTIPQWPQQEINRPKYKGYCLQWTDFQASLEADTDAWLNRLQHINLFDEEGPIRPIRPISAESFKFSIRQLASALAHSSVPIKNISDLAFICRPENSSKAIAYFLKRGSGKPSTQTAKLAQLIVNIARHWVRLPEEDIVKLKRIKSKVTPFARGMTEKNQLRLQQFNDDESKAALYILPLKILKSVERSSSINRETAIQLRMALALEILISAPIRLKNLLSLSLRHCANNVDVDRTSRIVFNIPADEVKNSEDITFELTGDSATLFKTYIKKYKSVLDPAGSNLLFAGKIKGSTLASAHFSRCLSRFILDNTGLRVNVHLLRHIAAKTFLDAFPGQYETVKRILHHRSIDTTTNHYTGLETEAAARQYDILIKSTKHKLYGH